LKFRLKDLTYSNIDMPQIDKEKRKEYNRLYYQKRKTNQKKTKSSNMEDKEVQTDPLTSSCITTTIDGVCNK